MARPVYTAPGVVAAVTADVFGTRLPLQASMVPLRLAEMNVCHNLFFEVKQMVIKASSLAHVGNCKKLRRNHKNRGLLLGI